MTAKTRDADNYPPTTARCGSCGGSGTITQDTPTGGKRHTCSDCNGTGKR